MRRNLFPVIIVFLLSAACEPIVYREEASCIPEIESTFSPEGLTINDFRDNVLRKEFTFKSPDTSSCYIIYWKEDGRQFITRATRPTTDHHLIVLNLEENSRYSYVIVRETKSGNRAKSEIGNFETQSIPLSHFSYQYNPHSQIYDESFTGYILTHQRDDHVKLIVILNNKGKIVWYEKFSRSPNVYNWTSDGTILCMLSDNESLLTESDEILEINLYGDTITHLKKGPDTFSKGIHHDIMLNREGNIYVINYDYRIIDFTILGYSDTDTLICDGITELDREGNKLWEWSIFDVADPLDDPESYVRRGDWLHANSILEDEEGNLLLSLRHPDQIWKIDRSTGSVCWKFGDEGDFTLNEEDRFSGQHHISYSHTGDLMLFDNSNETSQSRILYFQLNESLMTARLSHQINLPRHYYTYIMGSAYETPDHHLLISSTSAGAVALVDYAGSIIFEITTGTFAYKAILVEDLNDNFVYCER